MSTVIGRPYPDCMFVVGPEEQELFAHRERLYDNEYFKTMFASGMAEAKVKDSKTGELVPIPIPHDSPAAFRALLEFIYTGELHDGLDMDNVAHFGELCLLADKYMEPDLLKACRSKLARYLDWNSGPHFWALFYAYLGPNRQHPITKPIKRAIGHEQESSFSISGEKNELGRKIFFENCQLSELHMLASSAFSSFPLVRAKFVRNVLLPFLQRQFGPQDICDVYNELRRSKYSIVTVHKAAISKSILGRISDGTPTYIPTSEGNHIHFSAKAGQVFVRVGVDDGDYIGVGGGPVKLLGSGLQPFATIYQLKALEDATEGTTADETVLSVRAKISTNPLLATLHSFIAENLAQPGASLVGFHARFIHSLVKRNWRLLDPKLTADRLVQLVVQHLEERKSTPPGIAKSYRRFFQKIPWFWVSGARLAACMRLPNTGMDAKQWSEVLDEAIRSKEASTNDLNTDRRAARLKVFKLEDYVAANLAAAVPGEKRQREWEVPESNKRARLTK